jgi:hypothetical protein
MNKKGLSAVVASLLIVLITIAAVLLVWNVVKKNLESSGSQLSQADCIYVDVNIDSCSTSTKTAVVSLAGSITPTQLIVVFEDAEESDVQTILTEDIPVIGGKKSYNTTLTPIKVTVTPYIGTGENIMACGSMVETADCA